MFLLARRSEYNQKEAERKSSNQSINFNNLTVITFKMAAVERRNCVRIQHRAPCKINKYLREKTTKTVFM